MSSQIDQVKNAIDIVALIGERVKLTRAGKNYKGLCPFHSEKSPSFFVTPDLGRYKCFGCQESGDAFTFLMKMDNLTFAQALQELAKKAGITLESVPFTSEDKKRERLLSVLSLAKEFYHYLLMEHPIGEPGRLYLQDRGTKLSTVKDFSLGFSPPSWDGVERYLVGKKKFAIQDLIDVGLLIKNEHGRIYDRFRGRLMFPLTTPRGQVVGFSGRLLEKDAKEAKYINSPETSLYHKSDLLFGYSQLSSFIRKSGEVVVCEGEFDALSSMQAGVQNVVAIKGSALTQSQVKFLSHSVSRVLLSLDADSAGINATKRAIEVVKEVGADLSLRVIPLIGGKDPDDIARHDPAVWRKMVAGSVSVYEYLIDVAFAQHDVKTGDGKREITKELGPLIAGIENAVERAHYISQVSKRLGVTDEVLLSEIRKVKLPPIPEAQEKKVVPVVARSRRDVLERYILLFLFAVLLERSEYFLEMVTLVQAKVSFATPWKEIFQALYEARTTLDVAGVMSKLGEQYAESLTTLYLEAGEFDTVTLHREELERVLTEYQENVGKELTKKKIVRMSELEQRETLTAEEQKELEEIQHSLVI